MELFDPHSNTWLKNKFEYYDKLRQQNTLYYSEKYSAYIVTRYNDVMFALSNPNIFSSASGNLVIETVDRFGSTLGASDDPVHDKLKNVVRNAYSKSNLERVVESIKPILSKSLDSDDILNISNIAEEVSASVTVEILNLPYDKEIIKNLIIDIQRRSSSCVSFNTDNSSAKEFNKLVTKALVLDNKPAPGPGIYNEFVNNNIEGVNTLSLFIGPTVSGASSLSGALQLLTLDLYRTGRLTNLINDDSLIDKAINESLRFNASTGRFSRTVLETTTINNTILNPRDRVILCLDSANRDSHQFNNPDDFNLDRNTAGMAFGHGIHACIALVLSKAVMSVYLKNLISILGKYEIVTDELNYVITASGNNDMISNLMIKREAK